jgi:hypothetical protein
MLIKNKTISLIALTIILVSAILVLRAQKKESPSQVQADLSAQEQDFKEYAKQFPIADFLAHPPADFEERTRREVVSKKYDDALMPLNEQTSTIANNTHWAVPLTALPVEKSQVTVIGTILSARAYLSSDKTGVYSEFTIRVDEVLKDDSKLKLTTGGSVTADRIGGRVKYPSGHITLSYVNNQGMPIPGQRYVLFLTGNEQEINFDILTGYQLKGDRIALLDSPPQHPITRYKNADIQTFLNDLRAEIKKYSQVGTDR